MMVSDSGKMLRVEIAASLQNVETAVEHALAYLERAGCSHKKFVVELMLREFLNNAVVHGSRLDNSRHVWLELSIGSRLIHIRIEDQGPGFPWRYQITKSPPDQATSGRGLPLAKIYCSRVRYNHRGNKIHLSIDREES